MIYMQYKVLRKIDIVEMFTEHVLRAEKPMHAERWSDIDLMKYSEV